MYLRILAVFFDSAPLCPTGSYQPARRRRLTQADSPATRQGLHGRDHTTDHLLQRQASGSTTCQMSFGRPKFCPPQVEINAVFLQGQHKHLSPFRMSWSQTKSKAAFKCASASVRQKRLVVQGYLFTSVLA